MKTEWIEFVIEPKRLKEKLKKIETKEECREFIMNHFLSQISVNKTKGIEGTRNERLLKMAGEVIVRYGMPLSEFLLIEPTLLRDPLLLAIYELTEKDLEIEGQQENNLGNYAKTFVHQLVLHKELETTKVTSKKQQHQQEIKHQTVEYDEVSQQEAATFLEKVLQQQTPLLKDTLSQNKSDEHILRKNIEQTLAHYFLAQKEMKRLENLMNKATAIDKEPFEALKAFYRKQKNLKEPLHLLTLIKEGKEEDVFNYIIKNTLTTQTMSLTLLQTLFALIKDNIKWTIDDIDMFLALYSYLQQPQQHLTTFIERCLLNPYAFIKIISKMLTEQEIPETMKHLFKKLIPHVDDQVRKDMIAIYCPPHHSVATKRKTRCFDLPLLRDLNNEKKKKKKKKKETALLTIARSAYIQSNNASTKAAYQHYVTLVQDTSYDALLVKDTVDIAEFQKKFNQTQERPLDDHLVLLFYQLKESQHQAFLSLFDSLYDNDDNKTPVIHLMERVVTLQHLSSSDSFNCMSFFELFVVKKEIQWDLLFKLVTSRQNALILCSVKVIVGVVNSLFLKKASFESFYANVEALTSTKMVNPYPSSMVHVIERSGLLMIQYLLNAILSTSCSDSALYFLCSDICFLLHDHLGCLRAGFAGLSLESHYFSKIPPSLSSHESSLLMSFVHLHRFSDALILFQFCRSPPSSFSVIDVLSSFSLSRLPCLFSLPLLELLLSSTIDSSSSSSTENFPSSYLLSLLQNPHFNSANHPSHSSRFLEYRQCLALQSLYQSVL